MTNEHGAGCLCIPAYNNVPHVSSRLRWQVLDSGLSMLYRTGKIVDPAECWNVWRKLLNCGKIGFLWQRTVNMSPAKKIARRVLRVFFFGSSQ